MVPHRIEDALQLLRSEYQDIPGLSLTPADVARNLRVDRPTAGTILRALEYSHFLTRMPDGRFTLALHQTGDVES